MDGNIEALQCEDQKDSRLRKCLEDNSYSYSDLILDTNLLGKVRPALGHGLFQIVTPQQGEIQFERRKSLMFSLNSSLYYWIGFMDPNYNFITINPKTVPRTLYRLKKESGLIYIYLEVVLHISINRDERPCQSEPGYKFGTCVQEREARDVGCQSFWTNLSSVRTCSEEKALLSLINRHVQIQEMEKSQLEDETGCLKPCVYMEYRLAGEPTVTGEGTNISVTRIIFGSGDLQVEEEILAFSGTDLLADCGGILGLFIGFNFIMICDLLILVIKRSNEFFY